MSYGHLGHSGTFSGQINKLGVPINVVQASGLREGVKEMMMTHHLSPFKRQITIGS